MAQKRELEKLIIDFQERDTLSNYANLDNFLNLGEKQQVVYLGIDCTADSLHIGHLLPFMQGVRLATIGFKIKLLLGGATSKIGDPSDKLKERPLTSHETLFLNQRSIEAQLIDISRRNNADLRGLKEKPLSSFFSTNQTLLAKIYEILGLHEISGGMSEELWRQYLNNIWPVNVNYGNFALVNNQDWLGGLTLVDFVDIYARNVTVNYLLSKETIKQRVASKNGLSFSAFTYSLLQAYDFFYLYKNYQCHGQIGASDQWGNFTTGLKMINSLDHDNKCFALAFKLVLDESGRKISKSDTGRRVAWLAESKTSLSSLLDYFNNMSDQQTLQYVRKFTFLPLDKVNLLLDLNKPSSLRILQRILTEFFFFLMHGEKGLSWLQENATTSRRIAIR